MFLGGYFVHVLEQNSESCKLNILFLLTGFQERNALTLIKTECNLPADAFSRETRDQLSLEFPESYRIPDQVIAKRLDFRETSTFTIADKSTDCINLALSFDMVKAGQFLLGVHVADVTHYVKRGKLLDVEAYERGLILIFGDLFTADS